MTGVTFQSELLNYIVLVPAAILCFLPMRHQLRYGSVFSFMTMTSLLVVIVIAGAVIESSINLPPNALLAPLLLVCFLLYNILVNVRIFKSASIFMYVTTLLAFITNIAAGLSGIFNKTSEGTDPSTQAATLQLTLIILISLIVAYPIGSAGSYLVDNLDLSGVWFITILISSIFLVFNLIAFERQTAIFNLEDASDLYWGSLLIMFLLFIFLSVMFYFIVKGIVDKSEIEERNRIFEMEESQFIKQQSYMDESQAARHDFKHTIRTLNELVDSGDYEAVKSYIKKYAESVPQNDIIRFSSNNAVNALMNYYAEQAAKDKIEIDWIAAIPDKIPLSDMELCSLIGNILENAILACQEVPERERWIQLTAEAPNNTQFLVVATNSFNGKVRMRRGQYLSTRRDASGVGLTSITRTAARYGGTATFSHSSREFYSNVMIPLNQED